MPAQLCPNCQKAHDVGVYVSGQRIRCICGIHFDVRRTDVSQIGPRAAHALPATAPRVAGGAAPARRLGPSNEPTAEVAGGVDRTFISPQVRIDIPGYELKEVLGRGGMGEVWRAVQKSLGRMVAIKILPPKLAKDPEFVTRFEKEATALATLSHPNIIQIIDRGVAGEHYYFVMEFVQGRSLREIISGERLPPTRALKIVSEICEAIDHAHDQQIIHRDLKPENILLDERGHVKVADFGLAGMKGTESRLQLTGTAVAMGTINYMAPEQRRDAKNVDGRADLFSLGVLLYEMLTGELPVGRFELPSLRVPGLDPQLDAIVEKSLAQEPSGRYDRASLIGAELQEVLSRMQSSPSLSPGEISPRKPAAATALDRTPRPNLVAGAKPSVIRTSWNRIRLGLSVVGFIALLGFAIKWFTAQKEEGKNLLLDSTGLNALLDTSDSTEKHFPPNTDGELFVTSLQSPSGSDLLIDFSPGNEELNVHAGTWTLEDGKLKAVQAGTETDGSKHIPRAYVAHRYYLTDDFSAEVQMRLQPLGPEFSSEPDAQHYGELAMRIKDLQISIFAIPGAGMRLLWRYFTPDGIEQKGNSAQDTEAMLEDEMPVPPFGTTFKVKLTLKKKKGGVEVEAFSNGQRFAKKMFVGLEGRVGKIALGCRSHRCEFDNLKVVGKEVPRPQ